jgi:D-glycero-D-manno-heptose 1,7-bisphosphate phosphatase
MRLVVFNRDGLLNELPEHGITELSDWNPIAEAMEALAKLSQAGFTLVVANNQPEIAEGKLELDALEAIHTRLNELVENRGGTISAIFYCPHSEHDQCPCRKPNTGIIDAIELEFSIPATEMLLVTNTHDDVELATKVGANVFFVGQEQSPSDTELDSFANLRQAVDHIICHY